MELIEKIFANSKERRISAVELKFNGAEEKLYLDCQNVGYGDINYITVDNKESAINFLASTIEFGRGVLQEDNIPRFQCRKNSSELTSCTDQRYIMPSKTSYYIAMCLFDYIQYKEVDIGRIVKIDSEYKNSWSQDSINLDLVIALFNMAKSSRKHNSWAKDFVIDIDTYATQLCAVMGYNGLYYNKLYKFYEVIFGFGVEVTDKSLDGYLDVAEFFTKKGCSMSIERVAEEYVIRVSR